VQILRRIRTRASGTHLLFSKRHGNQGFTLIEMLLVAAIVAILASILIPNFLRSRTNANVAASKTGMRNLATALEEYFVDNRVYPTDTTLSILVTGQYMKGIPLDSCTSQAYVYTPTAPSYVLNTPSWAATTCTIIANGLSWTPEGGLVQY